MSNPSDVVVTIGVHGHTWRAEFNPTILADFLCRIKNIILEDYDADMEDKAQLYDWFCQMGLESLWEKRIQMPGTES